MFELKHLKTIALLAETNSISKTAELLFTSQSALSHQIKDLEQKLGDKLFFRGQQPLVLTSSGKVLLKLANSILPEIEHTQQQLKALKSPVSTQRINITFACHACFQWLVPTINELSDKYPNVDIQLTPPTFEQQMPKDRINTIELLFTDQSVSTASKNGKSQIEIGNFELVTVMAPKHPLAVKEYLKPEDFSQQTLLTYPIAQQQLDIFKLFLTPANIAPKALKTVDNSYTILQMVAANMGIACLPHWLVNSASMQGLIISKTLGLNGLTKTLYLKYQDVIAEQTVKSVINDICTKSSKAFKLLS